MQTHEGTWGCCIRSAWKTAALRAWAGAAWHAAAEAGPACAYRISVINLDLLGYSLLVCLQLSIKLPARSGIV